MLGSTENIYQDTCTLGACISKHVLKGMKNNSNNKKGKNERRDYIYNIIKKECHV